MRKQQSFQPARRFDATIDKLCHIKTVVQLKQQQAEWAQQADDKAEQLRELVGHSYQDLLVSAEQIIEMEKLTGGVLEELADIENYYMKLGEVEQRFSLSKDELLIECAEDFASFIFEAPEEIFSFLDENLNLEAVTRFMEVEFICTKLADENNPVRKKMDSLNLSQFVLESWSTVSSLKELLQAECQQALSNTECSCENVTSALAGLYLLNLDLDGSKLCAQLFDSRRGALEHVLQTMKECLTEENLEKEIREMILENGLRTITRILTETELQAKDLFGKTNSLQNHLEEHCSFWTCQFKTKAKHLKFDEKINVNVEVSTSEFEKVLFYRWKKNCSTMLMQRLSAILHLCKSAKESEKMWRASISELNNEGTDTWKIFLNQICCAHLQAVLESEFAEFSKQNDFSRQVCGVDPSEQTTEIIKTLVNNFAAQLFVVVGNVQNLLKLEENETCPKSFRTQLLINTTRRAQGICCKTLSEMFKGLISTKEEKPEKDLPMESSEEFEANNSMFLACVIQAVLPELQKLSSFLPKKNLEKLCRPLEDRSLDGFTLWSEWLSEDLKAELKTNLKKWERQWEKPETMKQAWKSIEGPVADDVMFVPSTVSNYILVFLFKLTHHMHSAYERLGNSNTLFRRTMNTVRNMLLAVYGDFLEEKDKSLHEDIATQLILDCEFLFHALPIEGNLDDTEGFLLRLNNLVDPVEWSFCKPHVDGSVKQMLSRTTLLYGTPNCKLEVNFSNSVDSTSMFPRAKPIGHIPSLPIARKQAPKRAASPKRRLGDPGLPFKRLNYREPKQESLGESLTQLKDTAKGLLGNMTNIWSSWGAPISLSTPESE